MEIDRTRLQRFDALRGKTLLICIGAAKCATSWIHAYLATLPEVVVSPLKELHFFSAKFAAYALGDMDLLAMKRVAYHLDHAGDDLSALRFGRDFQASVDRMQMIYDDNAYFAHFARLCRPGTFCDITPAYSVLGPAGFDYLRDFCAVQDIRVRILFVMRDPVDRLWSQLRHLQEMSPQRRITERWEEALQSTAIVARSDYAGTIEDIEARFAAEDILYLFYEDLFTEAALRRLCGFADAGYLPGDTATRRNRTGLERPLPQAARDAFRRALAPQYAFCRDRFGDAVPRDWRG